MGISDIFKKFFRGRSDNLSLFDSKYCINCSILIPNNEKICNKCGHNQNMPVIKKETNVVSMVDAFFAPYYNQELMSDTISQFNELISSFELKGNSETITEIQNELFFMDIAVRHILTLHHYRNNTKYKELKDKLDNKIKQFLADIWGQENLTNSYQLLIKRVSQYQKAFSQDDPILIISRMIQFIIVKIAHFNSDQAFNEIINSDALYMVGEKFWIPDLSTFMPCYIQVSNMMISYKNFLNRWEIR